MSRPSPPAARRPRILILGMGDLGSQIARMVAEQRLASVCMLAGNSGAAEQWAQLFGLTTGQTIHSRRVDALDLRAVTRLLEEFEPDLVIQAASLLSPFALERRETPAARAVLRAGFALPVSAQLPIVRHLMLARRALGMTFPVVNCSYPDLTHPLLACEGLAPTIGIGNVAILAMRFAHLIPGVAIGFLRVVAHHAHLGRSLRGDRPAPLVYLDDRRLPERELLLRTGLKGGPSLNYLAATTILPILGALLYPERSIQTHAPGVLGLPGGYPIHMRGGEIRLDLPPMLTREAAVHFNRESACLEGIDHIEHDGTLHYTTEAREAISAFCPELAEPLAPADALGRFAVLRSVLNDSAIETPLAVATR